MTTTKEFAPSAAIRVAGSAATTQSLGISRRRRRREDVTADSLLDPTGFVIGDRWVDSAPDPVLLDRRWAPDNLLIGSSLCLLGTAGTGKTQGGHRIITGTLAGGGQVVVADLRTGQESAALAERVALLLPDVRRRIVFLDDPAVCIDPLRIFTTGTDRYTHTIALCSVILGADWSDPGMGPLGQVLGRVITEIVAQPQARMADVISALENDSDSQRDGIGAAALKLRALAAHPLGRIIFGDGEPLTDPAAADYLVFAGHQLEVPGGCSPSGVPSPENALCQGLMYLVAVIAGQVALADRARVCLCVFEQPTALTASPDTKAVALNLLHHSRRMAVQVMFICQDGSDLEAVWAEMISYWFAFRHHTIASARRTLRCMGPYNDELATALISRDMSPGDCLVRDARGHTGLIRFRLAALWSPANIAGDAPAVTGGSFLARARNAAAGAANRLRPGAARSWKRRDSRRGRHS